MEINYPYTSCGERDYAYLQKHYPQLVEALGDYLFIEDQNDARWELSLNLIFVFFGSSRQRSFWLRDTEIDPQRVRLAIEPERLQGLRARAIPISMDPFWCPLGVDERAAFSASGNYVDDLKSRYGDLWDVRRKVNPITENKNWIRLV